MGKINTNNYPNRPVSDYQDDDMFILQDNGGETYTTNVGDIKDLIGEETDPKLALKVDKNGTDRLMTAAEGTKLAGIAAGAQVNVLEGVVVDSVVQPISGKKAFIDLSGKTDLRVIAFPFHDPEPGEPSMGFFKGAYVTYNGKLYEFTQEHQGAWNPSHVREINAAGWYVRVGNGGYNSGDYATTEGHSTRAEGEAAHAEGTGTIANSDNQHAGGRYNVADPDDTYVRIIGNGTGDNARSNALTLDWDGNLTVSGEVEDGNGEKLSDKADKVTNATSGHLAGLDSNGNLTDSGVSPTEDVTVEGNPVTFDSPFEQDAKNVVVSVKPIQDLHGYDHPWVGGAGKNKYIGSPSFNGYRDINTYTVSSETYNGHEVIYKSTPWSGACKQVSLKANVTYTFSAMVKCDSEQNVFIFGNDAEYLRQAVSNTWTRLSVQITPAEDVVETLRVESSTNITIYLSEYQLEENSSATSYSPYSNICPISGIAEVEIDVSADGNIVAWSDFHAPTGTTKTVNENTATLTCDGSSAYQSIDDGGSTYQGFTPGTYRVRFNVNSINNTSFCHLSLRASNHSIKDSVQITGTGKYSSLLTISENCYLSFILNGGTAISNTLVVSDLSVEKVVNTTTIPLPSTLYDADVDVTEGSGDSRFGMVDLGDLDWVYNENGFFYATPPTNLKGVIYGDEVPNWISDIYKAVPYNDFVNIYNSGTMTYGGDYIRFANSAYTDAAAFKTAMSGHQLCYELATPTTLSFTPADVELLEGTNVVSTNGEKVAVKYGRSLWQDIDDLKTDTEGKLDKSDVADIEGDTASKAYSVNDFMLRSDGFYKVTAPIASGASITSSNTTKTTVGEVLTALLNA